MPVEIDLLEIGSRIEELRGRLSQLDFAEMLGVDRKTVGTWERGERLPDTRALLALWSRFDADPAWVLTGCGFTPTTTEDERELLVLFRRAPLVGKVTAIGALQGSAGAGQVQHVKSNKGQVTQSGQIITVGGKKKK